MKVICVCNAIKHRTMDYGAVSKLVEGEVYNAYPSPHPQGYLLKEVSTINPSGFDKSRFIPLSTIDEKELLEERENQLQFK